MSLRIGTLSTLRLLFSLRGSYFVRYECDTKIALKLLKCSEWKFRDKANTGSYYVVKYEISQKETKTKKSYF